MMINMIIDGKEYSICDNRIKSKERFIRNFRVMFREYNDINIAYRFAISEELNNGYPNGHTDFDNYVPWQERWERYTDGRY